MGDFDTTTAIEALDLGGDHLEHFGVMGMHWGVIRDKIAGPGKVDSIGFEKLNAARDKMSRHTTYSPAWERDRANFEKVKKEVDAERATFVQKKAQAKTSKHDPHPDYNDGMRRHDKLRFSASAVKRINQSMNEGMTHREAAKKEQHRRDVQTKVAFGLAATVAVLHVVGPVLLSDIHRSAATHRDKRAQATEDFIRNGPQKPATKTAKMNSKGVFNVTTM